MSSNVYDEYVEVPESLSEVLLRTFVNHLNVYNYSLSILHKNNEISFKDLRKLIKSYLEINQVKPVLAIALFNELFYQYKKFKKFSRAQKRVSDIQYFTFLVTNDKAKEIVISQDRLSITFVTAGESITLPKPLPPIGNVPVYLNISYSNNEERYKVSLHASN